MVCARYLAGGGGPKRLRGSRTSTVQRELREIRVDLARLSDELSNITKFFGDWHLARIYKGLADRFHLADWHRTIEEKVKTLDDLYQLVRSDQPDAPSSAARQMHTASVIDWSGSEPEVVRRGAGDVERFEA